MVVSIVVEPVKTNSGEDTVNIIFTLNNIFRQKIQSRGNATLTPPSLRLDFPWTVLAMLRLGFCVSSIVCRGWLLY